MPATDIPRHYARALSAMVRSLAPSVAVEVGMAHGASTLAILEALPEHGRLVSIDPNQTSTFGSSGLQAVADAGFAHRHTLIEAPDYLALPRLLDRDTRIQFAYIDGWHTFDYTLLDAFYLDKMLEVGGVLAFNDCGMPAVHRVLNVLLTHRLYDEIDAGLHTTPAWESRRSKITRTVERVVGIDSDPAGPIRYEDRYFRKRDAWEPAWNFYAPF